MDTQIRSTTPKFNVVTVIVERGTGRTSGPIAVWRADLRRILMCLDFRHAWESAQLTQMRSLVQVPVPNLLLSGRFHHGLRHQDSAQSRVTVWRKAPVA